MLEKMSKLLLDNVVIANDNP